MFQILQNVTECIVHIDYLRDYFVLLGGHKAYISTAYFLYAAFITHEQRTSKPKWHLAKFILNFLKLPPSSADLFFTFEHIAF